MRTLISVFLTLLLALSLTAVAQAQDTATEVQRPTSFGAGEEVKAVDPNDPRSLLAECDRQLGACTRDGIGVPYLAAAYMALWTILLAFFLLVRRGQSQLEGELAELEARLREVEGGASDH